MFVNPWPVPDPDFSIPSNPLGELKTLSMLHAPGLTAGTAAFAGVADEATAAGVSSKASEIAATSLLLISVLLP
jgi:hypothetical protein